MTIRYSGWACAFIPFLVVNLNTNVLIPSTHVWMWGNAGDNNTTDTIAHTMSFGIALDEPLALLKGDVTFGSMNRGVTARFGIGKDSIHTNIYKLYGWK